jgi:hypothetical protein
MKKGAGRGLLPSLIRIRARRLIATDKIALAPLAGRGIRLRWHEANDSTRRRGLQKCEQYGFHDHSPSIVFCAFCALR